MWRWWFFPCVGLLSACAATSAKPSGNLSTLCDFDPDCLSACADADRDPDSPAAVRRCNRALAVADQRMTVEEQRDAAEAGSSAPLLAGPTAAPANAREALNGPPKEGPGAFASPSPLTPQTIFRRAYRSVVAVEAGNALGTGFVVHAGGVIVTNVHILAGAERASVVLHDGATLDVEEVVALDPEHDLAAILVLRRLPSLALAQFDVVAPGQPVFAIGNPHGLQSTITDGMVSGVRLVEPNTRVVQISAPISPGSSGGPVLNALGEVIGVATFGIPSGEALGFAVPVEYVRGMLKRRVSMSVAKLGALAKSRHAVWQDTDPAEGDAPSPPAASAAPPPPPNR